ncbi:Hypothetical protein A7982_08502 [Minicystis rosea]|nr:Hypothetical protein A7982_08502 [Minicystis rosea]
MERGRLGGEAIHSLHPGPELVGRNRNDFLQRANRVHVRRG